MSPTEPDGTPSPGTGLVRRLGLPSAMAVVVASMVGQMIFTSSGFLAYGLQHPGLVLLVWAVGGVHALAGALAYSELGTLLPRAGGEYAYLRAAFGPATGFLSGWASFLAGFSAATALGAIVFFQHLATFIPALDPTHGIAIGLGHGQIPLANLAAALLIIAITFFHYRRVSSGVIAHNALTILKFTALFVLVLAAAFSGKVELRRLSEGGIVPPLGTLLPLAGTGLMFVSLAYAGWNSAGYIAGEVKDPRRTLPRAAILGTLAITVLYLLVNAVYFSILPIGDAQPAPNIALLSAERCFGGAGTALLAVVVMLVQLASMSAYVLTGSRVYYAMGEDGVAWKRLAKLTGSQSTPRVAVALQGLVAAAMAALASFWSLALYSAAILTVFSALAVASLFVLRKKYATRDAYRPPLGSLWAILYLAITCVILAFFTWDLLEKSMRDPEMKDLKSTILWASSILVGLPIYFAFRSRETKPGPRPEPGSKSGGA